MATDRLTIGPFIAMWVGKYGVSDVLTRVNLERVGGGTLSINIPENFADSLDNTIQAGRVTVEANLRFASTDAKAIKLALGNYLDATNDDQPSDFALYSIVLLHPDVTQRESIWLPKCFTKKSLNLGYQKNDITSVPISIVATNRNRFVSPQLWYKRTKSELATLLGVRTPF